MNPIKRSLMVLLQVIGAVAALNSLQGCVPLVATGVGAAVLIADDRRTAGIYVEDEAIADKALVRIHTKYNDGVHVNVTSYNRIALLTGEVSSPEIRADVEHMVREIPNVRAAQNELVVTPTTTYMLRGNDSVLTSKVKARFVDANKFRANHVKVVTENGVVYLLGLVTRQEAATATELARTTGGVQRVVRVFEYID